MPSGQHGAGYFYDAVAQKENAMQSIILTICFITLLIMFRRREQ